MEREQMENGIIVKYDILAGAWTDGRNYVKSRIIREFTMKSTGRETKRGRVGRSEVSNYWLDKFGVLANVK